MMVVYTVNMGKKATCEEWAGSGELGEWYMLSGGGVWAGRGGGGGLL